MLISAVQQSKSAICCCCLVNKLCPTLWDPMDWKHARLPYPSLSPAVCSDLCPLSWWCHPTILCHPFLLLPSIFPSIRIFSNELALTSGSQSIVTSASASFFLMNIQSWFSLGLADLIFLTSKGLSKVFSNTTIWKHQFFSTKPSLLSKSHIHTWLLEKQ